MKKAFRVLFISSFVFSSYAIAHGPEEGYPMGPWTMWGWGHGFGWFWPVVMIIFWIAVIVGIVLLIRWVIQSTGKGVGAKSEESPLDILKKRYARGEIDKQEFDEKKKDLEV